MSFPELVTKPFYTVSALHNIGINEAIEDILIKHSFNHSQSASTIENQHKVIFSAGQMSVNQHY